ncbi:hypothetical protein C5167_043928 [Papaver somniferum]|uniref:Uncharacterized protein n=1 Tax=Papaver somniferum TaxID=3469 RepID=A0A4Y7LAN9_PAPSO|nr:hypothetical protein C5167_043928 [Papaver somniferum]
MRRRTKVLLPESAVGDPSLQAFLSKVRWAEKGVEFRLFLSLKLQPKGGTGAIEINSEVISRLIATHTEDV